MSLKLKIPLLVAVLFSLNALILYIYLNFYFLDVIADKISDLAGREITGEMLQGAPVTVSLIQFELAVFTILLLLIGIVAFFFIAFPMMRLNSIVRNYDQNAAVPFTKRRDEIGALQNSFAGLARQLQEEKQAQNRIIASISHDIKTPLTSILGYSETLAKKELPPERTARYLDIIHRAAIDIDNIIMEFDEFIKGKLESSLHRQNIKLNYLECMLIDEYNDDLAARGVSFQVNNTVIDRMEISGDLAKIRRVFANLIGNSIKHNARKEGLVITVTIANANGVVMFCVSDNGEGAHNTEHIFEPFYTSDTGRTVSGLGLSMCKSIITAHGGKIWAENVQTKGFAVWFLLG